MNPIPPALLTALEAAGFPADLHRFITDGTLEHYSTDDDGTLRFAVPQLTETRQDTDLIWHPEDEKTWRYGGMRFYIETNFYHDTERESFAGDELVDIGDAAGPAELALWLEAHGPEDADDDTGVPPFNPAADYDGETNGNRATKAHDTLEFYQLRCGDKSPVDSATLQDLLTDLFHWAHREGHNVDRGDEFMQELLDTAHRDFLREARYQPEATPIATSTTPPPVAGPLAGEALAKRKADFLEWHGYEAPEKLVEAWQAGTMALPDTQAVAAEFCRVLREAIKPVDMESVRRRNATTEYANCCASHDFCDANVSMSEAFANLGYDTAPDGSKDLFESSNDYADVWNAAWDLAKKSGFTL